jgi:hypothetical protein
MSRARLASTLLPLLLAACGGNVVVDASSAATTGTGGSSTSTTGAGGTVGTSTGTGGTVGTSSVASSSSTGAGGSTGAACPTGMFISLVQDNAPLQLTSSCSFQSPPVGVPFGQELMGGSSSSPGSLTIEGCVSSANDSDGLSITVIGASSPGAYMIAAGTSLYGIPVPMGAQLSGVLDVDQLGPVGGTITGSFQMPQAMLQGKFVVCRAPDIDAP